MQPQVITVHDIHKSIEDVGVYPYANTLVQDMGGEYWFVDAEIIADDKGGAQADWKYQIHHIPLKLAHFIIETLRLKAQFGRLGVGDIDEPVKQTVYLTPGTKIFGREVTELTEIPAKLRPVVVERL